MPRKPIGELAMTAAERKRRQRQRNKDAGASRNSVTKPIDDQATALRARVAELEEELEECREVLDRPHLSALQYAEMVMFCIDRESVDSDGPVLIHSLSDLVKERFDENVKFLGMTRHQWMETPDEFLLFWGAPLTEAVKHWRWQTDWWHVECHVAPQWDKGEILAEHERRSAERLAAYQHEREEREKAKATAPSRRRKS